MHGNHAAGGVQGEDPLTASEADGALVLELEVGPAPTEDAAVAVERGVLGDRVGDVVVHEPMIPQWVGVCTGREPSGGGDDHVLRPPHTLPDAAGDGPIGCRLGPVGECTGGRVDPPPTSPTPHEDGEGLGVASRSDDPALCFHSPMIPQLRPVCTGHWA